MNRHEKLLKFNGKAIILLSIDGTYWIPVKPILEALKMDADRSIKTLKNDPILGPERSIQTVQVSKNGKNQGRKMTCIPEEFVYGWIFSLRSDSKELTEYKKTCYQLLYKHFHGTITNRRDLLVERSLLDREIIELKKSLKQEDEMYNQLQELQSKRKVLSTQLNSSDKDLAKQPDLFENEII